MENISQQNREEIIKLHGKIDLVNQEITTIKENHLAHIDYKIRNIYKIVWVILTISLSGLANLVINLIA
jgi:hypothetical protein